MTSVTHVLGQQGIVPESALSGVKELFVPEEQLAQAQTEAESLPCYDITKVVSAQVAWPLGLRAQHRVDSFNPSPARVSVTVN